MQSSTSIYHNHTNENPNSFASHALSNISDPGENQISQRFNPNLGGFNYEQWISNTATQANPSYMSDIMNRTDQICLDANGTYSQMASLNPNNPVSTYTNMS
jgi:hypothetical protein